MVCQGVGARKSAFLLVLPPLAFLLIVGNGLARHLPSNGWSQAAAELLRIHVVGIPIGMGQAFKDTWAQSTEAILEKRGSNPSDILEDKTIRLVKRKSLRSPTVVTFESQQSRDTRRSTALNKRDETSTRRRTISLVIPLHIVGSDLSEQVAYLAYTAESKFRLESILTDVEVQVVLDSKHESTTELRALFPLLGQQCVWLDTIDDSQAYKATATRQQQWLQQRYPDDDPAIVTTEATLNVDNGRWKETANHLAMLLEQQRYAPSEMIVPTLSQSTTGASVSLPFIVSTSRPSISNAKTSSFHSRVKDIQRLFQVKEDQ
jgi:hypothetical protein